MEGFKRSSVLKASIFILCLCLNEAQEVSQECPETNGFYADSVQCDRYYECKDGQIFDKLCPDGLVFDENSIQFAKCSFYFSVDCNDRPELQPAKGNGVCPRLNGYFAHEDPRVCDKFYFCVDGVANPITCPASLIFDPSKGQCAYSDQVERKGCSSQEVFNFECPQNAESSHEHPRFPDPSDCQFFYICINGVSPRRNGCTDGLVFNKKSLACERPDKVEDECRSWYNETYLEGLKERRPQTAQAIEAPKNRKRVKVIRKNPNAILSSSQPEEESLPLVPSSPQGRPLRSRVRQRRPSRPLGPPHREEDEVSNDGAPTFALNDEDSIQQFRRNHGFQSSRGDSRLTILQTPSNPLSPPGVPSQVVQDEEELSESTPPRQRPGFRKRPVRRPGLARPTPPPGNESGGNHSPEFDSFRARF